MPLFPWPMLCFGFGVLSLWAGLFADFSQPDALNQEAFLKNSLAVRAVSVLTGSLALCVAFWLRLQN